MNYGKIVRLSAVYDLIVTFPFAFPKLCELQVEFLRRLHAQLHLTGSIPDFFPIHYFFINLMGSLVVVWSNLRIKHPEAVLGLFDSFARILFSGLMIYYLTVYKVTGLLWFLFFPEITWAAVQLYGYMNYRKSAPTKMTLK
ncbi:MAG: hypothetical protein ABI036_07520 [Fibrobacteria bacterium]